MKDDFVESLLETLREEFKKAKNIPDIVAALEILKFTVILGQLMGSKNEKRIQMSDL